MSQRRPLQASNRFTPPPFVNQAFVFSFFVSWVALFVDAGLTQFVPHCSEGSVDRRWWAALADNDF
jgi:hypothetical protein